MFLTTRELSLGIEAVRSEDIIWYGKCESRAVFGIQAQVDDLPFARFIVELSRRPNVKSVRQTKLII
jgi:hypothetical protein